MELNLDMTFEIDKRAWAILYLINQSELEDVEYNEFDLRFRVSPWYNGRERGFIISAARIGYTDSLHIVFFEHRNSDRMCALRFETESFGINPPNIGTHGDVAYPTNDKYNDIVFSVEYGQHQDMADWVVSQLNEFLSEERE